MSVKNLGIYMDSYLSFDVHTRELCKKAMGVLLYINRIKEKFDKSTRQTIVQTLALSLVSYGNIVWGTTIKTNILKVQKIKKICSKSHRWKGEEI